MRSPFWFLIPTAAAALTAAVVFSGAAPGAEVEDAQGCGRRIFMRHCVHCHGNQGAGDGLLADRLLPKPRDFTRGRFLLVSGENGVPTLNDLKTTICNGIPGTAMPSFGHLGCGDVEAVAGYVLQLAASGLEEQLVEEIQLNEGEVDLVQVEEMVVERLVPEAEIEIPPPSLAAQSELSPLPLYRKYCADCHGAQGRGDGVREMQDERGQPTKPRDIRDGIFKGGGDFASLYKRIRLGMPGSAMPAFAMSDEEAAVLVALVQRMAQNGGQVPMPEAVQAVWLSELPKGSDAEAWRGIPQVEIPVQPLRWIDEPARSVHVQAAHDGREIAFRMAWELNPASSRQVNAGIQLCNYVDPPFFTGFHGGQQDLCVFRPPQEPPEELKPYIRRIQGTAVAEEGLAEVVLRRPLAPSGDLQCDLRPEAGLRYGQFLIATVGEDQKPAEAFSLWLPIQR
ncbi:MAG: hypothetical protein DWQ01_17345 [Planctomycetota bacterium]|nr:MAG: hypothetical protein DWQ01_17345 [Planctomycetota bacterium]